MSSHNNTRRRGAETRPSCTGEAAPRGPRCEAEPGEAAARRGVRRRGAGVAAKAARRRLGAGGAAQAAPRVAAPSEAAPGEAA